MYLFLWKMWNWKDPNGLDVHPWMVGYRIPEVKLFRLRLGFWNCSPLIRVRVRFCACFQDALRALPVAQHHHGVSAVASGGILSTPLSSWCVIDPSTHFIRIAALSFCSRPFLGLLCVCFLLCFFGGRFDQGCVDCSRLWGGGSDQPEWWVKSLDSIFFLFNSFGLRQPSVCEP